MEINAENLEAQKREQRRNDKMFWRSIGGKKGSMQFMFADADRYHRMKSITAIIGLLSVLSVLVGVGAIAWAILSMVFWIAGYLLIFLGPLLVGGVDKWNSLFDGASMERGVYIGLICIGVFVVLIVVNFLIKWLAMLTESHRLNADREKNKSYIAISKAVKRSELCGFITKVALAVIIIGTGLIISGGNVPADTQWVYILLAAVLSAGALVGSGIYTNKQLNAVMPEMRSVKKDRATVDAALLKPAAGEANQNADNN